MTDAQAIRKLAELFAMSIESARNHITEAARDLNVLEAAARSLQAQADRIDAQALDPLPPPDPARPGTRRTPQGPGQDRDQQGHQAEGFQDGSDRQHGLK